MSRDISLLHPELQEIISVFLKKCAALDFKVGISQTWRSKAEQDELYAQGRTKPGSIVTRAKYPKSPHNWGVAFDIYRNDGKGAYYDADGWFRKVGQVGKSCGLFWGGDFRTFVDQPHFEMPEYLPNNSVNTLIAKYGTPEKFKETWEDDFVTQEKFNEMMDNYLKSLSKEDPSAWSEEARKWAEENGIILGDQNGNKQYKNFCTREAMVQFLYRMVKMLRE